MSEDRINSVIDEPRIKSEFDRLYALLQKAKDLVIELNASGKGIGLSAGFGESVAATKKANDALAQLAKLKEQINLAESEYGQLLAKSRVQLQEQTRLNKQAAQESLGMVDAYKKLVNQYNEAQRAAKNLAVTQGINSAAAKEAATRALDLSNQLKAIDASVGQYQRNVGNYASATFALSQILREAPSFAFNFQTGLLAISNNLPILFDEFDRLSKAIDENTQKQIGAVGALGKLARSLFSVSNLLTLGVTLITLFGKDIGNWIKGLIDAARGVDDLAHRQELLNKTFEDAGKKAGDDIAKLELYRQALTDVSIPQKERIELAKEYNEIADKGNEINVKEIDNIGQINSLIDRQIQLIKDRAVAKAAENKISESAAKLLEAELKNADTLAKGDAIAPEDEAAQQALGRAGALRLPNQAELNDPEVQNQLKEAGKRQAAVLSAAAKFRNTPEYKAAQKEVQDARAAFNRDLGILSPLVDPQGLGDKSDPKGGKTEDIASKQLKALLESQKTALEASAAQQEAIFNNEKETFDKRIAAAEAFSLIQNAIARKQQEIEVLEAGKVTNKKLESEENYKKASIQNEIERQKNFREIAKSATEEDTRTILANSEKRLAALGIQEDRELEFLKERYEQGKIDKKEYEEEKLRIQNTYANLEIQEEIRVTQEIIALRKSRGEDVSAAEKQLAELENRLRDENRKYQEDQLKKESDLLKKYNSEKLEIEKQYNDKLKALRQDVFNFAVSIGDAFFEREKNELQSRIDNIDREKEAEIAAVNASTATQEEKANQIAVINAQALAQREAIERRQREIDTKAAMFQKVVAVLGIGITTAQTVFQLQAAAARIIAEYNALGPAGAAVGAALAGQVYAQIPLVIAGGAIQAAAIAAKPIPRYKYGTDDHPGGPALVNDGGQMEVLESPDGKAYIPYGRNVLMDIPAHYKVHPSIEDYLEAGGAATMRALPSIDGTAASVDRMTRAVLDGFEKQTDKILDGLERSKTAIHINNSPLGVRATVSKAAQKMRWLNHEFDL